MGHIGQTINLNIKNMSLKEIFFLNYINKDVFIVDRLYCFCS